MLKNAETSIVPNMKRLSKSNVPLFLSFHPTSIYMFPLLIAEEIGRTT